MSTLQPSFEQENGSILIPMHTSQPANEGRENCWERNFNEEFPISSVDNKDNEATIIIGAPHLDYKITTHLKDQKMDGESKLLSDKDVLVAKLTFVDGIANGPCTLYDENGALFFEGSFVNGYRQGKGKEYENDIVVYEGLYEKGKKLVKMTEMDGYWKEYDNSKNLHSICKKDEEGRNNGVCFFYENGEISRLSEWQEGKETPFNGHFRLYDETNRKWIEGEYKDGVRNGESREYDENGKLVFEGYYENGKKLNLVRSDEMPGYWKEYDENGNLKSICKKDKYGRYEGECHFYENGTVIKTSEWHEGIELSQNTSSKSSDEAQPVLNEEIENSDWSDGNSTDYYTSDSNQFEGPNNNGNKFIPLKYMKGYWEELDNKGKIVRICQIDAEGKYNGLSYQYRENQIIRVSRWEKDKEREPLKSFQNGMMTEYKDGKKCYSGGYIPSLKLNYPRQGKGEEFDIDGESLIYKGNFNKGKRDGHGKLFKHSMAVYDGEWKKGMKEFYYYLYLILTLAIMLLTSVASFIFFNAYVGAIVSGLFITAICFYYNQYAGYIASGLFLVMCCFFANLYAGIIASVVFTITISFYLNVLAGLVPTGLVIVAACFYYNTFAGIFALGLFLIYLIFLVVHCYGWKKSIIWSSAVYILSLCTIVTLMLIFNKADLMKYVIIFAIGVFLILFISWIAGCKKETTNTLISGAFIILISCTIISLLLHTIQPFYTKYVLISLVGFLLIFVVNLIVSERGRSPTIVLKSAAAIIVCCIIVSTAVGSDSVPILRYVSVFAGGLLLIIIISYFTGCNKENIHILLSSSGLIISGCVMVNILLSSINLSSIKYYFVFLIGIILFFLIYLIVSVCRADTVIAFASLFIILAICGMTDLIMAALEIYYMRFVAVAVAGVLLIIIISCITGCKSENIHILISSSGLIVCCCVITSFFLSSMSIISMKYYFVFLIGIILFFLIYVIVSLCRADTIIAFVSLGIILTICGMTDLIMAALEIYYMRFVAVAVAGVLLIIIISFITGCNSENIHILISSSGLVVCCCVITSFFLSSMSIISMKYYFVFLIGITLFFLIYVIVSLCRAKEGIAFASLFIILVICGMTDLIMAALEIYYMRFVAIAVAGVLLIIIISFITGCNSENIHILISSSGLVVCCCVITSFFLSSMSIISMKYYFVFLIGITLFFLIYVIVSLCRAKEGIAFASLFIILVICGMTDLIMAALEIYYMRFVAVAVAGVMLIIIISFITGCNSENMHILISSSGLIICCCVIASFFLSSLSIISMKYYLVFLIGITLFFSIYLIVSLCRANEGIAFVSLFIILAICGMTDLIMAALEIYNMRFVTIAVAGVLLIIIISFGTGCNSENMHILISSSGLIICCCILAILLLSSVSIISIKFYFVFLIGMTLFFLIYVISSLRNADMVAIFKFFCTDVAICGTIDLIMASFANYISGYLTIIIIGLIFITLLLIYTECGSLNEHALFSGIPLTISVCYLLCWLLGASGVIYNKYIFVFVIWMLLFFSVYFYISVTEGEMFSVKVWLHYSGLFGIGLELLLGSIENLTIRIISIYLVGGYIVYESLFNPKDLYEWYTKTLGVFMGIFISSLVCMILGGSENPIVGLLFMISAIPSIPFLLILYCINCCADMFSGCRL